MRFLTNAPAEYDYGYVRNVGVTNYYAYEGASPVEVRVVEIPAESAAYQTARYQSGLYIAVEAD